MKNTLIVAMAVLFTGCPVGLGERCSGEGRGECPSPLICTPVADGSPQGICDYPPVQAGGPCSQAAECASPLTCSNHFTAGERYGACVAPRPTGEGCLVDRDCESGRCEGATGAALGACL